MESTVAEEKRPL